MLGFCFLAFKSRFSKILFFFKLETYRKKVQITAGQRASAARFLKTRGPDSPNRVSCYRYLRRVRFRLSGTPVPCLIRPERCINKRLARHNAVSEHRQSSRSDEPCAVGEYYTERHVRHTPKHATNNGALRVHPQRLHNPQHPAAMPVPMQPALAAFLLSH